MLDISPTEWTAIELSLRVATVATLVATPLGIAVAWLLARRDFWGKSALDAAIHLPLVLPPVVTGYLLLISFGRRGPVGAFLYDHLGGRKMLPPTRALDLTSAPEGRPIRKAFKRAFEYSDCWVDDARLVVLNAVDAVQHGPHDRAQGLDVQAQRRVLERLAEGPGEVPNRGG